MKQKLLLSLVLVIVLGVVFRTMVADESSPGPVRAEGADEPAPIVRPSGAAIMVLPFTSTTSEESPSQVFAEGLYDDLSSRLGQTGAFRVVTDRGLVGVPIPEIAELLGVDAVLRGAVVRSGSTLEINVELIEGRSEKSLWTESYRSEFTVENIADLQLDIAHRVADALQTEVSPEAEAALAELGTQSVEALECFQHGNLLLNTLGTTERESLDQVLSDFQCASEADPGFAAAWGMLGIVRAVYPWRGWTPPEVMVEAESFAERAASLAPNGVETLLAKGYLCYYQRDYDRAAEHFARGFERWPGDVRILQALSLARRRQGQWEEAARLGDLVRDLSPRSWWRVQVTTSRGLGRFEAAVAELELALDREAEPMLTVVREERFLTALYSGDLLDVAAVMIQMDDGATPSERASWNARLAFYRRSWDDMIRYGRDAPPDQRHLLMALGAWGGGRADVQRAHADSALTYWEGVVSATRPQTVDHAMALSQEGIALALLGWRAEAVEAAMRATRLLPIGQDAFEGPVLVWQLARVYALLGDFPAAIDALALAIGAPGGYPAPLLPHDPTWDEIRDDPRLLRLTRLP